jgi:PAS domain S-box-containing protein
MTRQETLTEGRRPATAVPNFWAVFESAPDAYLLLAPDPPRFTMVAANETRLRVTMTRREDVIGRPLFEVFPDNPTDPGATGVRNLLASLHEVLRTGKPHRMALQKYDIRTPAGAFEERYWDPLNSPVFDDGGNLIYIIHRVEDVTEQVRSGRRLRVLESVLEKLRESEERYRLLADMIPQHIWTTDPEGYHGYFSRRWYDFTGATLEETEGDRWLRFIHPDDRERTVARWQHSLKTGEPYSIEYRFRGADGEYRWFLGQAMPEHDEAGRITGWFGTLTDISDRKRLDEERERLLAREREAREQVTTILEGITDAFFAVDREWRFTYVNREAERLLKRSREELLGHSLWGEFSGAVGSRFEHEYRRAMTEETTVEFEAFAPTIRIWVNARAYPTGDGLSVFFRDVTARKQAEEKLRESERNFRALANSIPQLAWMAEPAGSIFWYNERWFEYTGTTLDEMQGWGWRKVHHPEHVDRVVERIRHAFETGEDWEDTFPLRSRTGEYRWFLSRAVPIRDAEGNVVRWFGTNTDITESIEAAAERERLLERERKAREELERVTESRERLMRGFSHDLKNPLGAADGHAQLLEAGYAGEISDEQRESVLQIRSSIRSALGLINDLLQLAKTEAGHIDVQTQPMDIRETVRELAEAFRPQCNAKGLAIDVQLPDDFPSIESDAARVRQVLGNLISNAIKYTPAGRVEIRLGLRNNPASPRPAQCVAIDVSDTGPGIPETKRHLLFQEFVRLDPEAAAGAGIGLTISRRLARALGGDITVESEAGRGTTFTLWLPPAGDAMRTG